MIRQRRPRKITLEADDPRWRKLPIVAGLKTSDTSERLVARLIEVSPTQEAVWILEIPVWTLPGNAAPAWAPI